MVFIKLTGYKHGSTVMLLISRIIALDRAVNQDGVEYTEINLDGATGILFAVKETPEQIMEMIENAKN